MGNLNAMDDPRFAAAVEATGRRKVILSGITTDFCLVYPALSLIAAGYHVFIAVVTIMRTGAMRTSSGRQRASSVSSEPARICSAGWQRL